MPRAGVLVPPRGARRRAAELQQRSVEEVVLMRRSQPELYSSPNAKAKSRSMTALPRRRRGKLGPVGGGGPMITNKNRKTERYGAWAPGVQSGAAFLASTSSTSSAPVVGVHASVLRPLGLMSPHYMQMGANPLSGDVLGWDGPRSDAMGQVLRFRGDAEQAAAGGRTDRIPASADTVKLLAQMTDKCTKMAARMQGLEKRLAARSDAELEVERLRGLLDAHKQEQVAMAGRGATPNISFRFSEIDGLLGRLDTVFEDTGQLMRARYEAATRVQCIIRRKLQQRRFRKFVVAVRRWRVRLSGPFLKIVQATTSRIKDEQKAMNQMAMSRELKRELIVFQAWRKVVAKVRPQNQARMAAVMKAILRRDEGMLERIFRSWKECALGTGSRKNVAKSNKERYEAAREAVRNSDRFKKMGGKVVTKDMIVREMEADAMRRIRANKLKWIQIRYIRAWFRETAGEIREMTKVARKHYWDRAVPPIFKAWGGWVRALDQGVGFAPRKRERFVPKVNMRTIVNHYSVTHLRKHLNAWRKFAHPRALMRQRMAQHKTNVAAKAIKLWRAQAVLQIKTKSVCVTEWRNYSHRLCSVPFRAWYIWCSQRRAKHRARIALISAFKRRQRSHLTYRIFRLWKHMSVFGKVEGLKSRLDLIRVLEEQKHFSASLEETIDKCQDEQKVLENLLRQEQATNLAHVEKQAEMATQIQEAQFTQAHCEAEVLRLQTILDALKLIYPATVKQLSALERRENGGGAGDGGEEEDLEELDAAAAEERLLKAEESKQEARAKDLGPFLKMRRMEQKDPTRFAGLGGDGAGGDDAGALLGPEPSTDVETDDGSRSGSPRSARERPASSRSGGGGRSGRSGNHEGAAAGAGSRPGTGKNTKSRPRSRAGSAASSAAGAAGAAGADAAAVGSPSALTLSDAASTLSAAEMMAQVQAQQAAQRKLDLQDPNSDASVLDRARAVMRHLDGAGGETYSAVAGLKEHSARALLHWIATGDMDAAALMDDTNTGNIQGRWQDFLQNLSLVYDPVHPLHSSAKDKLQVRLAKRKAERGAKMKAKGIESMHEGTAGVAEDEIAHERLNLYSSKLHQQLAEEKEAEEEKQRKDI